MNIEISNEMIEQMVQVEVQERVAKWFNDNKNKYIIREYVGREVKALVENELRDLHPIDIKGIANNLGKDLVANKCAESICDAIAYAFADKYGD